VRFLQTLATEERLRYGTEHDSATGTSLRYENGTLYADCWGLIKLASILFLDKETTSGLSFEKVNNMYNVFKNKNLLLDFDDLDSLKSGAVVFRETTTKKAGFDHVYIYIQNYPTGEMQNGQPIIIKHALIGIGEPTEGKDADDFLQVRDLEEILAEIAQSEMPEEKKKAQLAVGYQYPF
jgi:hypothetical protein